MLITRVFQSGNSQAVRIPKEFQFEESEVEIFRRGEEIILRRRVDTLGDVLDIFAAFPDDFMAEGRQDAPPQQRNFEL